MGTLMMAGKFLLSFFLDDKVQKDQESAPRTFMVFLDDFMLKIRQVCQYSIHARPSHISRQPDDISSDAVHNLEAAALGKKVYNFNAFLAPWLAPIKAFFPHGSNPFTGIPSRLLHSLDAVIGKLTNIFWNIRRVSTGLVPYGGGMKTTALAKKQKDVRELVSYITNRFVNTPLKAGIDLLRGSSSESWNDQIDYWKDEVNSSRIKKIFWDSMKSWARNAKALVSKEYISVHRESDHLNSSPDPSLESLNLSKAKSKPIPVGSEEPTNSPLYVRLKILSQVIGFPAGLIGAVSNSLSIGFNVLGNVIGKKGEVLVKASNSLTDFANSLMAMVYLTGEVPANVNEYFKGKRSDGFGDKRHLGVAAIGALGMLNRIKYAPILGSLMGKLGIKPVLDTWHNQFEKLFLGFFSANRWLLHEREKLEAENIASARDLNDAEKHENLYKLLALPIRVIFGDPDVSYKDDTAGSYRNTRLSDVLVN